MLIIQKGIGWKHDPEVADGLISADIADYVKEILALRGLLTECADDLDAEIEGRYDGTKDHPAMKRRYDRDRDAVVRAREFLAQLYTCNPNHKR